ncbi:hypothetical protein NOL51_15780 [Vibrio parahaemolyticus]|uniref:hypothetical protein n=1 Tax=Vibrio parahaemolyticus TaxID=670 RepID=UPI002269D928|nr:hypothetical protein [Vibrio parahaemolyticus]MCX8934522.1 hypothetical protein [Vibrio parahaemolyticus]
MKRLFYPLTVLFSSVSFANDNFEVSFMSDGFTLNEKPAISVIYCAKTREDDCISFNLNSDSIVALMRDGKIKNYKSNNTDFHVTGTMSGKHLSISAKHETGAALKLKLDDKQAKMLELNYVAQLYALPDAEYPEGSYMKFDQSTFAIKDEDYDTFFDIVK